MTPASCPKCRQVFEADMPLQLEIGRVAADHGATAARSRLNAALEGVHGGH